jgi:hypothetical protein
MASVMAKERDYVFIKIMNNAGGDRKMEKVRGEDVNLEKLHSKKSA